MSGTFGLQRTYQELRWTDDMDPMAAETDSDLESLEQDVLHVLVEVLGTNLADPDKGVGLLTLLSGPSAILLASGPLCDAQLARVSRLTSSHTTITATSDPTQQSGVAYVINVTCQVQTDILNLQYVLNQNGLTVPSAGGAGVTAAQPPTSMPVRSGLILSLRSDLGIVLNGSTVSNWADQSGNVNNFAQATAGKQPLYTTHTLAGRNVLYFDGARNMLGANYLLDPAPRSFAAVVVPRAPGSTQALYSSDGALYLDTGGSGWDAYNCTASSSLVSGTPYALIANVHASNNVDQYTNGTLQTALTGYGNNNRGSTRIGSDAGGTVQFMTADLAEFAVWNRDLSASEIASIRNYITTFWGFSA